MHPEPTQSNDPSQARRPGEFTCNLDLALAFARAGFKVFPCDWRPKAEDNPSPSKAPLTEGDWRIAATADETTIREWWTRWPEALIGLPAGLNGFAVIDADRHGGPDGVDAFESLADWHGGLPDGVPAVTTQSGGRHYIFAQPAQRIGCERGALPPAIDVRGDGGYIIAPGARLADGRGWHIDDVEVFILRASCGFLPEVPAWLREIIATKKERKAHGVGGAAMPEGVTADEIEKLTRGLAAEVASLATMTTERGTKCADIGRQFGPLFNSGVLSIPEWQDKIREVFPNDENDNGAGHSFLNGIKQSDGSGLASKLAALRANARAIEEAKAAGLPMGGFDLSPVAAPPAEIKPALWDHGATLGNKRKSKAATEERVGFARLCSALKKLDVLTEHESFELARIAKAFDANTISDGRNPFAPTPDATKLAEKVLQVARDGGDLVLTLALGEAVLKPLVIPVNGLPIIKGGMWPMDDAFFAAISARIACINRNGNVFFVHKTLDGRDQFMTLDALRVLYSNVFAGNTDCRELAVDWWRKEPGFKPKNGVFKPHGGVADDEYNFWKGFGIERRVGRDLVAPFVRHLWRIVCKRDKAKFKYLWRWLAWAVQNPGKPAETVPVFKNRKEGAGKSTVSDAMRVIFGFHAVTISNPDELLGKHNDNLQFASFVAIEEAIFAGDPRQARAMRSRITNRTIRIEPKFMAASDEPNIMHAILTANDDWAVHAGDEARRWFICEVDESRAGDKPYWDRLYGDLEAGGHGQLLDALLETDLEGWHPRDVVRTEELREQQAMSADTVAQWIAAGRENGHLNFTNERGILERVDFGEVHRTETLYGSYAAFAKRSRLRPLPEGGGAFGKALTHLLGEAARRKNIPDPLGGNKRGRGYLLPELPEPKPEPDRADPATWATAAASAA